MAENHPSSSAVLPQLAEHGITQADVATAVRVLKAVATLKPGKKRKNSSTDNEDPLADYQHSNLRALRKALANCIDLHKMTMYNGKTEEEYYANRLAERSLKRQKKAEAALHQKYIASTALRKGRVERLQKLQQEAKEEELAKMASMIPDGHVETLPLLLDNGDDTKELPKFRSCYVCKVRFRQLHHFYDQLCPDCAALNWEKRQQTADCSGKVAVVTGSRVKIGLQVCLKLLRAGATVVATTRFPNSAIDVYRQEQDFDEWKDRLHVYGLDLRDVTGLEAFTRFLKMQYPSGIDILINNACQTVRRPVGYYVPLVEKEQQLWHDADDIHRSILGGCVAFERVRRRLDLDHRQGGVAQLTADSQPRALLPSSVTVEEASDDDGGGDSKPAATTTTLTKSSANGNNQEHAESSFEKTGLSHSAAMSQMVILPEDAGISASILPPGISDINGQQLDLRTTNSWLLKMEEVSTPEVMECMFVNAIAPFVLNSRLKPLMCQPHNDSRPDRYIINVSAMEGTNCDSAVGAARSCPHHSHIPCAGKFNRYKMPNHPHTNMAKAALNMMTRTSAEDLATKHRIYMNSVDTGWINDENPLEKAKKTAVNNLFQTPIDEIDAAARILDPVFVGVSGGREYQHDFGKFLKDYRESEW